MNHTIILAGGIGSRFWPLSTQIAPKQFLNLFSDNSLLSECLERINILIPRRNIYIATNKIYKEKIKYCVKKFGIPFENFLFEPQVKNTLAPIGLLSHWISNKDKEAIILVLPSDHFIKDKEKFLKTLKRAIIIAKQGYIVTLGIIPKRPETGYGYIKIKSKVKRQKSKVYEIDRFIEKPSLQKAKKFIKDRRYYWNGGIFIFKAKVLLDEIERFNFRSYKIMMKIKNKNDLNKFWDKFPSVSIDYAIMEKTKRLSLVTADCGWVDLGSWRAVEEIIKKDKNGNIFKGKHIDLGSKNTTVWSEKRPVVTLGLKNIVIVDAEQGLLVCEKNRAQDIKKIVQILKQKKLKK